MFKSLLQLASANILAQIISFSIMPIITRLHTPDSLGKYQFFITLALVLTPFISGSFAIAIESSTSKHRALVNLKLGMQFSFIVLIALIIISPIIMFLLSISQIDWFTFYLPLLVIFMYLSANFQFAMGFMTNSRSYSNQSTYTITKSGVSNILKLCFSLISKTGFSLVFALVITELFQVYRVVRVNYKGIKSFLIRFKWRVFKRNFFEVKIYPTYVTMATVLSILMNWFPILITGIFYGPKYAGLLGLAFMVVNTPVYPFISALQNVCFGELSRSRTPNKLKSIYKKSMLIALVPCILGLYILYKFGGELFSVIFGSEWTSAGRYAFICFIPISLSFILSPVYNTLNHFFSFQKLFFWINCIMLFIGSFATSYIGYNSYDFDLFIIVFAFTMSIGHLILFSSSVILTIYVKKQINYNS